jgi:hypothetical protein
MTENKSESLIGDISLIPSSRDETSGKVWEGCCNKDSAGWRWNWSVDERERT